MKQGEANGLPLVDGSVLARLRAETDNDDGIWKVFVRSFIEQMPVRTGKLRSTLTSGDAKGALAAVLSLGTTAQMVGAAQLTEVARELEREVRGAARGPDPASVLPGLAAIHLRGILHSAERTMRQLEALIT